ncbi:HbrB family protein involved in TOR signaling Bit2 [Schizosaccharomyces osmophilus]|uniref:HbrB family protein involved in TOR signaling Bit2 n=1 Tax=Schizosaccharomyces osmophilus TaxID=2545709 RepID=A0AAE9WE76_9SCHI|nr:HbrB family protein involved in TOR signaling Bit2 [Schizosaccharomyces osmophilus]WBW73611.1 HbrB family protein involved in TOR signaling Bit2 [Schizosaccharomyces osmophilus]
MKSVKIRRIRIGPLILEYSDGFSINIFIQKRNRIITSNPEKSKTTTKKRRTISNESILSKGSVKSITPRRSKAGFLVQQYKQYIRCKKSDNDPPTVLLAWKELNLAMRPLFPQHRTNTSDADSWRKQIVVEELNLLLLRCISACEAIRDFDDLIETARVSLTVDISLMNGIRKQLHGTIELIEEWRMFYSESLPYIEATFLPITFERIEIAQLFEEPMKSYWLKKSEQIDVKVLCLWAFRTFVVIPKLKKISNAATDFPKLENSQRVSLLQMISIIFLVKPIEECDIILLNWLRSLVLNQTIEDPISCI